VFLALEKVASTTKKAELSSFLRSADWSALPLGLTAANVDKPFEMIGFVAASMVSMIMVVYGLVSKII
jgi:hypothetical protein